MITRPRIRVQYLTATVASQVDPKRYEDEEVVHYSIPAIQDAGGPAIERASTIESNKLLLRGDEVLVSRLNPHKNCITRVTEDYRPILSSTEFVALTPERIEPRFLVYSFQSDETSQDLTSRAVSATRSHSRVDPSEIIKFKIPHFSAQDQRRIADYLDAQTAEIDALIAQKERMLALLEEKRAAVVTHAVTRGLDPTVKLKPSGLDWLGDVPEHWEVRRLKFLLDGIDQGWSPQCYNFPADYGRWGVLKTGCVNGGIFHEEENKALPEDVDPPDGIEVQVGDVLMSRASGSVDLIGSVALVEATPKARLLLSDKTFRLRPTTELLESGFLVATMGSAVLRHQIKGYISGAEGLANNIARTDIDDLMIPLPPPEEQKAIVSHLDSEKGEVRQLSVALESSISLLKERRSALITAAVTGQIRSRRWRHEPRTTEPGAR